MLGAIGLHSKQPMLPFGIGCTALNVEDGVHKLCLLLMTHCLYTKKHEHFEIAKRGDTETNLNCRAHLEMAMQDYGLGLRVGLKDLPTLRTRIHINF